MYLFVAAVVLSGCGVLNKQELKPTAPTLTHGRLVYLADRACAADRHRTNGLKKAADEDSFIKNLHIAIKSGERLIFVLRGLEPPPSDAVAYRRLLAAENGADLNANRLLDAIGDEPLRRIEHYFKRGSVYNRRIDSRAKKLGMRICAKD